MGKGKIKLLIVATDLAENSKEKIIKEAVKNNVPYKIYETKEKLFHEYNRILMFGTDEEKEEHLNWEEMDDTEKKAFAKALGNHIVAITCEYFDEHTVNRSKRNEITHMVGKEIVLQMTQMWL